MRIVITVAVMDDNWTRLSREVSADQAGIFSANGRAKPIARVRADALRQTKNALDRLLAQAIEIPDDDAEVPA